MLPEITSTWQLVLSLWFVLEWTLRVVMIFVVPAVPRNRLASSANAWLLFIMIVPVIGTAMFFVFGNPKLPKGRRNAQKRADKKTNDQLKFVQSKLKSPSKHEDFPEDVAKLGEELGGLPVMAGNSAEFITDYVEMIHAQAAAIDKANKYVHFEYFIIVKDNRTQPIFDAFARAVQRGVTVRVLFDQFATKRYPGFKQMLQFFDEVGVQWRPMLPYSLKPGNEFTRFDLRNHRKVVVIDGEVGFTGSANVVKRNYHKYKELKYEDMLITVKGPIVWQLNSVFRADWYAETQDFIEEHMKFEHAITHKDNSSMQVLPSGPSHPDDNNPMMYTSLVHAAKHRISIVVPYFVPDEPLMNGLISAAKRGVDVTIINSEIIDKTLTGHAQRSYYDQLLSAGIHVYLYKKPIFLHNKQVLIDDAVAAVGSSNIDERSFELSMEVTLLLYDKKLIKELDKIEDTYKLNATKLHLKSWRARSWGSKMLDNVARLTSSLQ